MDSQNVHTNCVKVLFPATSKMPTDDEIFGFLRKQEWSPDSLVAMFRAPREHCIYVKFKSEDLFKAALLKSPASETFTYGNNETVQVSFTSAQGNFRYVRLFGLPVEVENKHIVNVLSKYGKIHQAVRERYGPDTGYPILNGVRGVHMEISKEIPCQLHVQHFQIRVFYAGITNTCFSCGSSEHIKVDCPNRKGNGSKTITYADAAKKQGELQPCPTDKPVEEKGKEDGGSKPDVHQVLSLEELPFGSVDDIPDAPIPKLTDDGDDWTEQGRSISKKRLRSQQNINKKAGEKESDSSPDKTKVPRSVRVTEEQAKYRRKK